LRFLFVFLEKPRATKKMRGKMVKKGEPKSVPIMMFTRLREQIEGNRLRNRAKIMRNQKKNQTKTNFSGSFRDKLEENLEDFSKNLHNNAKMFAIFH
jgi:hypothetical protein